MIFNFTDNNSWSYQFELDENDLAFVSIIVRNELGRQIHRECIPFCQDVFSWRFYHTRVDQPLVSPEAREFCERKVSRYMKMKAFW